MSFDVTSLTDVLVTRVEANEIIRQLEMLKESLYKSGDMGFNEALNSGVNNKLHQVIKDEIVNCQCNSDIGCINTLLQEIIDSVNSVKNIKLEVSEEPTGKMLDKFHKWIKERTGDVKILDIFVDRGIIGGARIIYEGKYYDGTLNKKWDQIWEEIRTEIFTKIR